MKPVSIIPQGVYCHGEFKSTARGGVAESCPYWDLVYIDISDEEGETQEFIEEGYCAYLEISDLILLRDQCKICNVNEGDYDDISF